MDFYIVRIFSSDQQMPDVKFGCEDCGFMKEGATLLYLEYILRRRKSRVLGSTFEISSGYNNSGDPVVWADLEITPNGSLEDKNTHKMSCRSAGDALLRLSDNMPLPGTFILYIIWDLRGFRLVDKSCAPLVGALKKACSWHHGHLKIYSESEPDDRISYMINFMDENAEIYKVCENERASAALSDRTFWHGCLEIPSTTAQSIILSGFKLLKWENSDQVLKCCMKYEHDVGCSRDEDLGSVWIDPKLKVLSLIDMSTIPLFYYTGKKFLLQGRINEKNLESRKRLDRLCRAVNSRAVNGYFCSLKYAISTSTFENAPELSSEKWRETVLKRPNDLSAPNYSFTSEIKSIPLMIRQSDQDRAVSSDRGGKIVRFTAHVLLGPQELTIKYPSLLNAIISPTKLLNDLPKSADDVKSTYLKDLPRINAHGLFRENEIFSQNMCDAIKKWVTENGGTTSIPISELQKFADDSAKILDSADESLSFDCSDLPEEYTSPHQQSPPVKSLYEKYKQAIARMSKDTGSTQAGLSPPAPPQKLDMHLKADDILKHFEMSGENKNGDPVLLRQCSDVSEIPSVEILGKFDEALKMSYHGITYNLDEQESERLDRRYRRLVEQRVKFETCSIGSSEKVPSPATIIVVKSPMKQSPLGVAGTAAIDKEKSNQLKKVAEKIYKRRNSTRKRNADSCTPKPSTSTMVLRSTPKKSKPSSSNSEDSQANSAEQRLRRRSYVQDNKKRLQEIAAQALYDNGVEKGSTKFNRDLKTLFDVSMAFLRSLKSSKDLDRIMTETVKRNVQSVISFKPR